MNIMVSRNAKKVIEDVVKTAEQNPASRPKKIHPALSMQKVFAPDELRP
jgi:hypothetical protein